MKTILALSALALALSATVASAEWTQPSKVRFEQGNNYTPWADADVTFATGVEMNKQTGTFDYNALGGRYAIIRSTGGATVVVRLNGVAFCVGDFNQTCLPGGKGEGFDDQTRHWQICTTPSCT
jgi:opacity protein-like surface antigen